MKMNPLGSLIYEKLGFEALSLSICVFVYVFERLWKMVLKTEVKMLGTWLQLVEIKLKVRTIYWVFFFPCDCEQNYRRIRENY